MTKEQEKRLEELEQSAINRYLDKTDFNIGDWLDEEELKEWEKLEELSNN